jgi:hypothetical protein
MEEVRTSELSICSNETTRSVSLKTNFDAYSAVPPHLRPCPLNVSGFGRVTYIIQSDSYRTEPMSSDCHYTDCAILRRTIDTMQRRDLMCLAEYGGHFSTWCEVTLFGLKYSQIYGFYSI